MHTANKNQHTKTYKSFNGHQTQESINSIALKGKICNDNNTSSSEFQWMLSH